MAENRPSRAFKGGKRPGWCRPFLDAYRATGDMTAARKIAGIGRAATYSHREKDPPFADEWDEIQAHWVDIGVEACRQRWIYGAPETVFLVTRRDPDTGEVEYAEKTVRKHSAAREKFWLERMRPEAFSDKQQGQTSADEMARKIHDALDAIAGSMDQDAPEDEAA